MKIVQRLGAACMAVGLAWLSASAAHADVKYTSTVGMGSAHQGLSMKTTTFVKGERERTEHTMEMGPIHMNMVSITQCDRHQTVRVDPDLKIYTVGPIGGPGGMTTPMGVMERRPRGGVGGTGQTVITYTVQDLGYEKIGELNTHHSMITMQMQSSGCAGKSDQTFKNEVWTAKIPAFSCPERQAPTRTVEEHGCNITYETHGDTARMASAMAGVPVRLKVYNGDEVVTTQDLADYSTAPLSEALFDVPSDFKKVSETEFAQAEKEKMMRSMRP